MAALSLSSRGPNAIGSGSRKRQMVDLWTCQGLPSDVKKRERGSYERVPLKRLVSWSSFRDDFPTSPVHR
jgi:hypothetical protein